jgi:hypothetical protein
MAVTSLSRKNDEAAIAELQAEEAVLGKYRDMGFFSLDEAMSYISGKICEIKENLGYGGTSEH